jgi:hypothetical protein
MAELFSVRKKSAGPRQGRGSALVSGWSKASGVDTFIRQQFNLLLLLNRMMHICYPTNVPDNKEITIILSRHPHNQNKELNVYAI